MASEAVWRLWGYKCPPNATTARIFTDQNVINYRIDPLVRHWKCYHLGLKCSDTAGHLENFPLVYLWPCQTKTRRDLVIHCTVVGYAALNNLSVLHNTHISVLCAGADLSAGNGKPTKVGARRCSATWRRTAPSCTTELPRVAAAAAAPLILLPKPELPPAMDELASFRHQVQIRFKE